jgi:hypothetical protein
MVELGQQSLQNSQIATTIDRLATGDVYERLLAIQSCFGSRDGERVVRACEDPSRLIRGRARKLLSIVGTDRQVLTILTSTTNKHRRYLLKRLVKRHRTGVVDEFVERLAATNDRDFERFLPFAAAMASRFIAAKGVEIVAGTQSDTWYGQYISLAVYHPALTLDLLTKRANRVTEIDRQLLYRVQTVSDILAKHDPHQTLALIHILHRHAPLDLLPLDAIAEYLPELVADLVLQSQDIVGAKFDRVAHRLGIDRLKQLIRQRPQTVANIHVWFPRLSPSDRAEIYHAEAAKYRDRDGCLDPDFIDLLPADLRVTEAIYHLNLPILMTRVERRLAYVKFITWEDARSTIGLVKFHRDRLPDVLQLVIDRKNEQDPIRQTMASGLADLPPGIWRSAHLLLLTQIIEQALAAADLSMETARHIEWAIIKILPVHPDWAAPELAKFVKARGYLNYRYASQSLEQRLADRDIQRIAPHLFPILQSWHTRERAGQILAVAGMLGRRLAVWDELVDLLESLVRNAIDSYTANSALNTLAVYRRDRLPTLIPQLIQQDPSWATQPVVYNYLHRHRQDLITPFLGQKAYRGKFSTGETRFVLPLDRDFYRWLPSQQDTFAKTLCELTRDSQRDIPTLLFAIDRLGCLNSEIATQKLIALAALQNPQLAVRDRALRKLANLDAGQGLPTLLDAMADDRARIAIYALRRAVLEMPGDLAVRTLAGISLARVTVAKEVVRLLGDLPGEDGYRQLLVLTDRELHRDVRIALLRALWEHLDRDRTWEILDRSAQAPDSASAMLLVRIPTLQVTVAVQPKLLNLFALLLQHPDPLVRLAMLQRCQQMPITDRDRVLLPHFLTALNSPFRDEQQAAIDGLFGTYERDVDAIGMTIIKLQTDLWLLQQVVKVLVLRVRQNRSQLQPIARRILMVLANNTIAFNLRVELAVSSLDEHELIAWLGETIERQEWNWETLSIAITAIEHNNHYRYNSYALASLEVNLALSEHPQLRRMGLAALLMRSTIQGWTDELKVRLAIYQQDSSALVVNTVAFIWVPAPIPVS